MYANDGNETILRIADPDGIECLLVVDDEDYAHLIHKGWKVREEVRQIFREPVTEEDFRRANSQGDNGHGYVHA